MVRLTKEELKTLSYHGNEKVREYFFLACSVALEQNISKKIMFHNEWVLVPKGYALLDSDEHTSEIVEVLKQARLVRVSKPPVPDSIFLEIKPMTRLIEKVDPELKEKYNRFIEALSKAWGKKVRPCNKSEIRFAKLYKKHGMETLVRAATVAITVFPHNENGGKYLTAEFITREDKLNRFLSITPIQPSFNFISPAR